MSSSSTRRLSALERAVLAHVAILMAGSSWAFGGNIWWARDAIGLWTGLAPVFTVLALLQPAERGRSARRRLVWLIAPALFTGLVTISLFNPSFRQVSVDGEIAYVRSALAYPDLPSTISPERSLASWRFGAGIFLSAFNIALAVHSRSALRGLLAFAAANTLMLAVLGTLQKLSGSGFYFGHATSPNPRFFATFIYYNHWGAFMIVGLATAIGLLYHHAARRSARDLWHSPFTLALLGAFLIAASAPVSASRAATAMAATVAAIALAHGSVRVAASRRARQLSPWPAIFALLAVVTVATSAVAWLSFSSLTERFTETKRLIDADKSVFGGRADLYQDTLALVRAKPAFGWGLDTYDVSLQLERPYTVNLRDRNQNLYATAHSDWLQSLSETGAVGTILLLASMVVPLVSLPRRVFKHPLVGYPLLGCGVVLLYAWIEFPFANAAVLIAFCTAFFTAVRYGRLHENSTGLSGSPCFPSSS